MNRCAQMNSRMHQMLLCRTPSRWERRAGPHCVSSPGHLAPPPHPLQRHGPAGRMHPEIHFVLPPPDGIIPPHNEITLLMIGIIAYGTLYPATSTSVRHTPWLRHPTALLANYFHNLQARPAHSCCSSVKTSYPQLSPPPARRVLPPFMPIR